MDATSKRAIEAAITHVGEQYREVLMDVYKLGKFDGAIEALTKAHPELEEVKEAA